MLEQTYEINEFQEILNEIIDFKTFLARSILEAIESYFELDDFAEALEKYASDPKNRDLAFKAAKAANEIKNKLSNGSTLMAEVDIQLFKIRNKITAYSVLDEEIPFW